MLFQPAADMLVISLTVFPSKMFWILFIVTICVSNETKVYRFVQLHRVFIHSFWLIFILVSECCLKCTCFNDVLADILRWHGLKYLAIVLTLSKQKNNSFKTKDICFGYN